ncbi:MAG TPA: hypothetical protein VL379_15955 [Pseudomonadales bacterium]|nr:hypothetical protein [Pseudomonadales bacterium]
MIRLTPLRELTLTTPSSRGRPPFLSAASGLVALGSHLYVVADDELQLGRFPQSGDAPGELLRLRPGLLPDAYAERKARKPDFEALVRLPPLDDRAAGTLLALGSGSTPNRYTGALISVTEDGFLVATSRAIDLGDIYRTIAPRFHTLNIEGGVIVGEQLVLLQRGNKHQSQCAYVRLHLPDVLAALASTDSLGNVAPIGVRTYDLGAIDGVPLCFSDGAALPDGSIVFAAIAEAAANSYDDGPCKGAAIGVTNSAGELRFLERVDRGHKIEGIEAQVDGTRVRLRLVTDADDAAAPAQLLGAEIDGYPFR